MAEIASYKEWGCAQVINSFSQGNITVSHANKSWGKWYEYPEKDNKIEDSEINKIVIKPDEHVYIATSGRSGASSGCEVTFDLNDGNTRICTIYFSCPFASGTVNVVEVRNRDRKYPVTVSPYNRDHGALGMFDVEVYRKG